MILGYQQSAQIVGDDLDKVRHKFMSIVKKLEPNQN